MTPLHVLNFVNFKIDELEKRKSSNKSLYAKKLEEFNALPFYKKMFATHPADYGWSFHFLKASILELENIRLEAAYAVKMQYNTIAIDPSWHDAFYKWADSNKVPY